MKTVRGTLVGFEEITKRLVNVTLRLDWSPEFQIQTGATYLVAFERAYEKPPEIVASAVPASQTASEDGR